MNPRITQQIWLTSILFIAAGILIILFSGNVSIGVLTDRLDMWTSAVKGLLLPLVAVGILTSALVEAFKSIAQPRAGYHRYKVLRWVNRDAGNYQTLVNLATAGDETTLMRLPTDQLMGQINAAVQIAVQAVIQDPTQDAYASLIRTIGNVAPPNLVNALIGPDTTEEDRQRAAPRLLPFIQRRLDGLQLSIESRWKTYLQWLAVAVGAGIIFLTMFDEVNFITLVGMSLVGGMVAPIARDIVAAINNARAALK